MRILITGAYGFIGQNLVQALRREKGVEIALFGDVWYPNDKAKKSVIGRPKIVSRLVEIALTYTKTAAGSR